MLEKLLWISATFTLSFCNPSSLPIGLVAIFIFQSIFWALPLCLRCKPAVSLMPIPVTPSPMGGFCYLKIYSTVLFGILNITSHFSLDCYIYQNILPPVFELVASILSKSVGGRGWAWVCVFFSVKHCARLKNLAPFCTARTWVYLTKAKRGLPHTTSGISHLSTAITSLKYLPGSFCSSVTSPWRPACLEVYFSQPWTSEHLLSSLVCINAKNKHLASVITIYHRKNDKRFLHPGQVSDRWQLPTRIRFCWEAPYYQTWLFGSPAEVGGG